jgi:hypothetical protein
MSLMTTLEVPVPQVLVFFEGDVSGPWDHRLALRRDRNSTWILLTSAMGLQVTDLSVVWIIGLVKSSSMSPGVIGNCYRFDPSVEDDRSDETGNCYLVAARMAEVLVAIPPAAVSEILGQSEWFQADFGRGERYMSSEDHSSLAIDCQKSFYLAKQEHCVLSSTRASEVVLTAVRSTGVKLSSYHHKESGIHGETSTRWEHKIDHFLFKALGWLSNLVPGSP